MAMEFQDLHAVHGIGAASNLANRTAKCTPIPADVKIRFHGDMLDHRRKWDLESALKIPSMRTWEMHYMINAHVELPGNSEGGQQGASAPARQNSTA